MNRCPDSLIIAKRNLNARTEVGSRWVAVPDAWMTLQQARDAYDRGEIETAHGKDGHFATLYAIPRKQREIRTPWFARTEN